MQEKEIKNKRTVEQNIELRQKKKNIRGRTNTETKKKKKNQIKNRRKSKCLKNCSENCNFFSHLFLRIA